VSWDADGYARALDFAATAHGAQVVPGSGFPYVVHLTKVAAEVARACVEDATLDASLAVTCALLHDCVEDAGVTVDALTQRFGPVVAQGVLALSKDKAVPKDARLADSLRRITQAPREVWVVKLGDRVTNLEPPPAHWPVEKRRAYRAEAEEILRALGPASSWLAQRMRARIAAYAAHC